MKHPHELEMLDALRRAKTILDNAGITFWLDCGTLLGAVRDGKFIPWDHDIDLGMWSDMRPLRDACVSKFKADGWKICAHTASSIKVRLCGEPPAGLDMYCYDYSEQDHRAILTSLSLSGKLLNYWLLVLSDPQNCEANLEAASIVKGICKIALIKASRVLGSFLRRHLSVYLSALYKKVEYKKPCWIIPAHHFLELSTIGFYGMEFRIPAEAEEYLTYRYGKDWHIPRSDWVTARDDGTVAKS